MTWQLGGGGKKKAEMSILKTGITETEETEAEKSLPPYYNLIYIMKTAKNITL